MAKVGDRVMVGRRANGVVMGMILGTIIKIHEEGHYRIKVDHTEIAAWIRKDGIYEITPLGEILYG